MPGPDCVLQLDKIMCDLTCTWTKRLVTWLVFGPNDLWLDLTSDQMTCDLTWTCTEMTCDLTWTCKEMTCDLTWTCKKWLAAISDNHWFATMTNECYILQTNKQDGSLNWRPVMYTRRHTWGGAILSLKVVRNKNKKASMLWLLFPPVHW